MRDRFRKFSKLTLVSLFLFVLVFGDLVLMNRVNAQPDGSVADFAALDAGGGVPVTDIGASVSRLMSSIKALIKSALISGGIRAASYALRKVAFDSAVWVASGGKGQSPLAHTGGFGGYLKNVGDEAAGTFISEMSSKAGVNLCKVPDIKIDLAIKVGLRTRFGGGPPAKPVCTLSQFTKNWSSGEAWSKYSDPNKLAKSFSSSIIANDSDLGIYIAATEKINNKIIQQKEAATLDRQEGDGIKSLNTLIGDQIKTPAALVKKTVEGLDPAETLKKNEALLNSALAGGDAKVFPAVLSIFLSTLGGTILNNFQTKGILPTGMCAGGIGGPGCSNGSGSYNNPLFNESGEGLTSLGRAAAKSFFNYLTAVKIKEVNRYDLASQLNSCPDSPGIYNCRAGDDLTNAIDQKITIEDAIKLGILDGNKKLIPDDVKTRSISNDLNCYLSAYCLNNVKVLRQLRILPLGFEIAISRSNPNDLSTLKSVVDAFNDKNSSFYHLIDPRWVIKAPEAKCNALVNSASLLGADLPARLQDCVDLQTCVGYDNNGNCIDYGYCTREQNTWKFPADKCSEQFATCAVFQNSKGNSVGYIKRTLDSAYCTQSNDGCTAYSLSRNSLNQWVAPQFPATASANAGIFLNSKAETDCSANSAGCSIFKIASANSNDYLNIKKAPDYLGCYDSNPATPAIDWPQTAIDLGRLSTNSECNNYAKACTADEASCNWYTPKNGGIKLPGRFVPAVVTTSSVIWNDQCDARCEGYNVYREMPSNYSNGQDLAYIIPSSGKTCVAEDEGCSSFTNLSTAVGGVENTEYYSYLRPCITMSEATSTVAKTFITYEGSKENGFQLHTYLMLFNQGTTDVPQNGPAGSPKYFYKDPAELASLNNECTEQRYKDGVASLDCRQFNDKDGNIYYRMISHTIPANEKCTGYRLNDPEFYVDATIVTPDACQTRLGNWTNSGGANVCEMCVQNGEYRNGACIYSGIPTGVQNPAGVSRSCGASADTCRAYKGNAGNNIQTVFSENFETASSSDGWVGGGFRALVSTRVGEYSFEHDGGGAFSKSLTLEPGKSYDLTFWASAASMANVTVSLNNGTANTMGVVSVSGVWRQYHLGTIELKGANPSVQLTFNHAAGDSIYLDNIKLVKVASYLYLVKNSLSVDPVCDSIPNDNLPGEALGCSAYSDPQGRSFYLTNFSFLCREDAIGCTALFDTFNTESTLPEAYHVWIPGAASTTVNGSIPAPYSCKIGDGQNGCYVDIKGYSLSTIRAALNGSVVASTVYIPGDTPSSSPVYLVANKAASCNEVDLGCSLAGKQVFGSNGWQFMTTTIKNVPASYADTLCESQATGCSAFSEGDSISYFKDPSVAGQTLCAYQTDVPVANGTSGTKRQNGWFLKTRVGICSNSSSLTCHENTAASDCGVGTAVCTQLTYDPCYPAEPQTTIGYDLLSFGTTGYQNIVGECPSDQNKCTEIIDHAGNSSNRKNYLIFDDKLTSGDCAGQVSQKLGCALFDQTDNPIKLWHTTSTYAFSETVENVLVSPSSTSNNDANLILKVVPDRSCGEWLSCGSSYSVYDDQTGKYRNVCNRIQRCNGSTCSGVNATYANSILNSDIYTARTTTWAGMDYAGYSLLGFYPVERFDQVNMVTSTDNPDWRLVKKVPCGVISGVSNCTTGSVNIYSCGEPSGYVDGLPCGTESVPGVCMNHICVQPPTGVDTAITQQELADISPSHSCRAYPESDSPFPRTQKIINGGAFSGVHICSEENPNGCECNYRKVSYGDSIIKYWNYSGNDSVDSKIGNLNGNDPVGICLGGTGEGNSCSTDSQCPEGACQFKSGTVRKLLGWKGFCLEKDTSRVLNADPAVNPCLTWFPVESLVGAADIYNQHTEAGTDWHATPHNGGYYCLSSSGTSTTRTARIAFSPSGLFAQDPRQDQCGNRGAFGLADCKTENCGNGCNYQYTREIFSRNIIDIPSQTEILENNTSRAYVAATDLVGIKKEDIGVIKISTLTGTGGAYNIPVGSNFYLNPNDLPNGTPQTYYHLVNNFGEMSAVVGGFYRGNPNDLLLFYSSSDQIPAVSNNIGLDVNTGLFNYYFREANVYDFPGLVGNLFSTTPSFKAGTIQVDDIWDANISNTYVIAAPATQIPDPYSDPMNPTYIDVPATVNTGFCPTDLIINGSHGHYDAPYTWHAIRFRFDPYTHQLVNVYTAFCGPVRGADDVVYQISFQTREWCTDLANDQIDLARSSGQRAIAWTDRLFSLPKSPPFSVPDLGFTYDTINPAFGSISPVLNPPLNQPVSLSPAPSIDCSSYNSNTSNCSSFAQPLINNSHTGSAYSRNSTFPNDVPYCVRGPCLIRNPFTNACMAYFIDCSLARPPAAGGNNYLLTVFAAHNNILSYRTSTASYVNNAVSTMPLNITQSGDYITGVQPKPPEIHPLGRSVSGTGSNAGVYYEELPALGFSVNNSSTGQVVSALGNGYNFSLDFFMFADKNQMPIRSVTIDWGDGYAPVPNAGSFRNQRGVTSTAPLKLQCQPRASAIDFGHILDQTCDNAYFHAENIYSCAGSAGNVCAGLNDSNCYVPANDARNLCPTAYQASGCCFFKPKVRIIDNWGWCNGSCIAGNGGCYDASVSGGINQCKEDPRSWTTFGGTVVVPSSN